MGIGAIPGWPHLANLTAIPGMMRAKGWTKAATLLEKWFNSPANNNPRKGQPETTTISLGWVLGFPRAATEFANMEKEKKWVNAAAKREITNFLTTQGLLHKDRKTDFGDLFSSPLCSSAWLDVHHIQFHPVGNPLADPVDELFAALGRFNFRMAVAGSVVPKWRGAKKLFDVQIKEVIVYVWDSFDFNGDQYLGCWNPQTNDVSKTPGLGYFQVTNEDFRDWRNRNGRGGDFLVFSHNKVVLQRTPPDTFEMDEGGRVL